MFIREFHHLITSHRLWISGVALLAMLFCALPITHGLQGGHDHHHHNVADVIGHSHDEAPDTDNEGTPIHQHLGLNETSPGFLGLLPVEFHQPSVAQRWALACAALPHQDLAYSLDRPPRENSLT
jgi:hypothetical protein